MSDMTAGEKKEADLLSEMRDTPDGRSIGDEDPVYYPKEMPVSRFYYQVRALRH